MGRAAKQRSSASELGRAAKQRSSAKQYGDSNDADSDGEKDVLAVATREAVEESGLEVVALDTEIFDIDVHKIPERGSFPAHYHFDVRFAFRSVSKNFSVSEESIDLEWVPIGDIRLRSTDDSVLRLKEKWLKRC